MLLFSLLLLLLFLVGVYFSKLTLDALREFYRKITNDSPYMVKYRITPLALLSLGIFYTVILVKILSRLFGILN